MQARVAREGEVLVVHLSGRLDVETAEPFRQACRNYLKGKKTVFDFEGVSFVGSCGILPFLDTMQEFALENAGGVKFSGVGSEFRRVFSATPLSHVEIYERPPHAVTAFANPQAAPAPLILAMLLPPPLAETLIEEEAYPATAPAPALALALEDETL